MNPGAWVRFHQHTKDICNEEINSKQAQMGT